VLGVEPERRLSLAFGMRAPGAGMMEFDLKPLGDGDNGGGTRLTMTAYWHPAGVWGLCASSQLSPMPVSTMSGTSQLGGALHDVADALDHGA
jgi:hypothetical protein